MYIYWWASPAFPSLCCLVVVLSFGWLSGILVRASRCRLHRGNLFASVGRLGSQFCFSGAVYKLI